MDTERSSLGIIGLGAFGRFIVKHLTPWFDVYGYDSDPARLEEVECRTATLAEVAAADIVVFAVPLASLEEVAEKARPHIRPGVLVMDVTSVKVKPLEILKDMIPEHASLLGTHPLFGPQSGREGIAGLRMALCPVRIASDCYYRVCDFLTERLQLLVLKADPDRHDQEMARVQAVTHFMSRALREIGLPPSPLATKAYEKLQEFASIVLSDSWDLFLTIQKGNPYADPLRKQLIDGLAGLEHQLTMSTETDLKPV